MNRYAIHTLRCAACSTTPSSAAGPTLVKAEASRRSGVTGSVRRSSSPQDPVGSDHSWRESMKHFNIIALAALALSLSTPAGALEPSKPGGCGGGAGSGLGDFGGGCGGGGSWGGVPIGPGPGDPGLDPSKMPRGGDEYNQKLVDRKEKEAERKEAERRKREAEQAAARTNYKTLGRVAPTSLSTPTPPRTLREAARDARARNSPAAPDLEAQWAPAAQIAFSYRNQCSDCALGLLSSDSCLISTCRRRSPSCCSALAHTWSR
jgi:hypothetical protein